MDPFLGQITAFGFNFAPYGWALCNGQLLSISQNTALFSLLGTNFGGDGRTTFGLPNLQAQVPVGMGQLTGGQAYEIGESGGAANVTLIAATVPQHTHSLAANTAHGTSASPEGLLLATPVGGSRTAPETGQIYKAAAPNTSLAPASISMAYSNAPHNNTQPTSTVSYCIALQGVFPARP